jgi:tRNA-(ms[2]io[6]A)-hydroxylase
MVPPTLGDRGKDPGRVGQACGSRVPGGTTGAWTRPALADPLALLDDHAHLERKAAGNALGLLHRAPADALLAAAWVRNLAAVARDETEHLGVVLRVLARRGGRLSAVHRNPYAAGLHALVRPGAGPGELLDRLLVAALIEARSCERFETLVGACDDEELRGLYRGLCASERGHYRVFLDLARSLPGAGDVDARWGWFLDREAEVLAAQRPGARMHAGDPGPLDRPAP